MKYLTNKRFIGVHTLSTILWRSERLIFFLPARFSVLCCSNKSGDHKWGSVSQERTLMPGKEGAQTRRLLTWGMLPSSWVCGSKHTNLCKGVSRGWGHWPEAPCSTCDWETCNARFNKWSLFFYETGIIQVVRTRGLPISELQSVPKKVLERDGKMSPWYKCDYFFSL